MTSPSPVLYVAWRDPHSRMIPVGRLLRCDDGTYEFAYVAGIKDAAQRGFEPFLAFPDSHTVYRFDSLPPFFQNRVMRSSRPDYAEYVTALGLDPSTTDPFTILASNEGRRATDQIEVFPELRVLPDGKTHGRFFVRGVRHVASAEDQIKRLAVGDRLLCIRDVQNDTNRLAIGLRTQDHAIIGYCPEYLFEGLTVLLEQDPELLITIERVNPPPAPVHHRLLVSLTARAHVAPNPKYEPIVPEASPLPPAANSAPTHSPPT